MINQILAKRYAKALLTLGREDGDFEQYGAELQGFVTFWESETEFADAASNPLYAKENRKAIVKAVVDKMELSPVFKSLLDLMIEKNRLAIIPEVGIFYQKLLDELNNISRAKVTSATPLSEEAMESIKASLEKTTGSSVARNGVALNVLGDDLGGEQEIELQLATDTTAVNAPSRLILAVDHLVVGRIAHRSATADAAKVLDLPIASPVLV